MEEILNKFENLKAFVKSKTNGENTYVKLFLTTSLDHFLLIVKQKKVLGITGEQCVDEILNLVEIEKDKVLKEDYEHICRYLEYFMQIVDYIK